MVEECVANVRKGQMLLDGLRVKITTLAKLLGMSHDDCVGDLLGTESPA